MLKILSKKISIAILFAIIFTLLPATWQFARDGFEKWDLEQTPASEFFVYYKIEPSKRFYNYTEEIKFTSYYDVSRPLSFRYNDILYCDYINDESEGHVNVGSSQNFNDHIDPIDSGRALWVWEGTKPKTPSDCYVEANVSADVGQGVTKFQKILSDDFRFE